MMLRVAAAPAVAVANKKEMPSTSSPRRGLPPHARAAGAPRDRGPAQQHPRRRISR